MLCVSYDYVVVDDVCNLRFWSDEKDSWGFTLELQGRNYWWLSEDVAGYILNVGRCKKRGDQSGRR